MRHGHNGDPYAITCESNTSSKVGVLPIRGEGEKLAVNLGRIREYLRSNADDFPTFYVFPERDNGVSYLRLATCVFSFVVQLNRPRVDIVVRRRGEFCQPLLPVNSVTKPKAEENGPQPIEDWLPVGSQGYSYGDLSDDFFDKYKTVAVGGTFDRLHAGHRLLLTAAVWAAEENLRVGITSEVMLQNKKHRDLIENLEFRSESAVAYSKRVKPSILNVIVTHLKDSSGPTSYDPSINALVVSKETAHGAQKINDTRREAGLAPLVFIIVDVLDTKGVKLSSSALREAEAERRLNSVKA